MDEQMLPIVVEVPAVAADHLRELSDSYPGHAQVVDSRREFNATEPTVQLVLLLTTSTLSTATMIVRTVILRHKHVRFKAKGIEIQGMSAEQVENTLRVLLQGAAASHDGADSESATD